LKTTLDNLNKIKKLIKEDKHLSQMKGGVLYSNISTLKKGKFYFLGVNPGGTNADSILENIDFKGDKESHFLEAWDNGNGEYESGEAPLQKRVIELFEKVDTSIINVCSSNLIFRQSKDLKELEGGLVKNANICWKVHELLVNEIVQPKYIISHGGFVYDYLVNNQGFKKEKIFESGHGSWTIKVAKKDDITLINLPHLSYYTPFTKNEKKQKALNEFLELID
jgi:hypothetical protein